MSDAWTYRGGPFRVVDHDWDYFDALEDTRTEEQVMACECVFDRPCGFRRLTAAIFQATMTPEGWFDLPGYKVVKDLRGLFGVQIEPAAAPPSDPTWDPNRIGVMRYVSMEGPAWAVERTPPTAEQRRNRDIAFGTPRWFAEVIPHAVCRGYRETWWPVDGVWEIPHYGLVTNASLQDAFGFMLENRWRTGLGSKAVGSPNGPHYEYR